MQSKIGQELNRIMRETGMTPLETMSRYLEVSALSMGNHKFYPLPPKSEEPK